MCVSTCLALQQKVGGRGGCLSEVATEPPLSEHPMPSLMKSARELGTKLSTFPINTMTVENFEAQKKDFDCCVLAFEACWSSFVESVQKFEEAANEKKKD
jgi:hypothetical protein